MLIVIDSNVLFSALIKDSTTRRLILEYTGFFLFPEFIFEEMEKHKDELLQKSKMSEEDFNQLLELLLTKVLIVPNLSLEKHYDKAFELVKDIDQDDLLFFACTLHYPESVIWSDDAKLKKQSKIKIINTYEMMGLL